MTRSLNTELRPQSLDEFIGAESVISQIKEALKQGRVENTYLFSGPPGTGKTSMARVIAKLINGEQIDYDIEEIDTSELSAEKMREVIARSRNNPWIGPYKCFIINEAQKLSGPAQEVLLDSLEEPCPSTVWFLCSSEPGKLSQALIRRCTHHKMPGLSPAQIGTMVWRTIKAAGAEKYLVVAANGAAPAQQLVDALIVKDVNSPGFIVKAVEKLISGATVEEASQVQESALIDTFAIAKAAAFGDWDTLRALLKDAPLSAARDIRGKTAGFFRSLLLKEAADSKRAARCVWAIAQLAELANQNQFEDGLIWSATCASLYNICVGQKEYLKAKKG